MKYNTKLLKKLRNNFFVLSSSIFLFVLVGAFAAIYINTYISVQQEIETRLDEIRLEAQVFSLNSTTDPSILRINLSETQEISRVYSLRDIQKDVLEQLINPFRGERTPLTPFDAPELLRAGGRDWKVVSSAIIVTVDGPEQSVIFFDITDFNNTLSSLFYTLLLITFIVVPIVGGVSYYFATRSVKPIAEAWESQKQFITDASHELKTPLTIIKSNLGIIRSNSNETVSTQMEWLDYVDTGAERMSKLVNDLLSLAIADSTDLHIQKENFDLSCAIADLLNTMAAKAEKKSIEIITSIQPNISLNSDKEKIIQVATILFDNAIKYSEPNDSINIYLTRRNQGTSLSVTNSGRGIKEAELNNIFERFYQTEPSRNSKSEGFGLGLSIAIALTEKLGGKLSVVSGENENTTFTFEL